MSSRLHPQLRSSLEALLASYDSAAHLRADPVRYVHRYAEPADQEVVGLLASALAFGNVTAVRASVGWVLDRLGPHPATALAGLTRVQLAARLRGFVHRVYRTRHVVQLLSRASALQQAYGSLGQAFVAHRTATDFREALARFADDLRGPNPDRSMAHLVPNPRAGSACKRLLLYLRWMVRPADGIDLGLWTVPPRDLIIPVDTHIHRISQNLGLTKRRTASWATAEEITHVLRRFDPRDPVKYDFALCHFGSHGSAPAGEIRFDARVAFCGSRAANGHAVRADVGRAGRSR